ncbi:MAG: hypothetical protein ACYC4L_03415 [Chloroflexota bacterium]
MTSKADFTPEEWQQIITAPQMATFYIALASPSGPIGAIQEMMVFPKLLVETMKTAGGNALIDAVTADYKEKIDRKERVEPPPLAKDSEAIKAQSLQACRDLATLLAQKAPAEAEGYKQWVYQAAQHSAEAAKEGGFLGIGGTKVNEAEATALRDLAGTLGIPA